MSDNVGMTPGTGATVAADDVGGVLHQRVKVSIGADGSAADLAFGSAAAASSLPVAQSTEDIARAGIITETAPASDTASSGLNGRLQRVAQRLTSLIALLPAALGAGGGLKVDGSGTALPVSLAALPALAAGTANIGDVDVLTIPALVAGTATIGAIAPVPKATASGATSSRINAAASTNATSLKGSAGNVVNLDVFNVAAYDVFLKLYNKATAPTVGSDTPVWTIPIKAGTGYSRTFDLGKSFATGIAYAITKLQADSDTTVVVAGDLTGSIDWI